MESRISIVTIAVDDLDRTARFYEALGLVRHRIQDGVAFFQMGGVILALFPRKSAEADTGIAFGTAPSRVYLAYNTRSDAEVGEVLVQAGRAFWGGWYGYFADPEDNIWEVAHNPDFPLGPEGNIALPA